MTARAGHHDTWSGSTASGPIGAESLDSVQCTLFVDRRGLCICRGRPAGLPVGTFPAAKVAVVRAVFVKQVCGRQAYQGLQIEHGVGYSLRESISANMGAPALQVEEGKAGRQASSCAANVCKAVLI